MHAAGEDMRICLLRTGAVPERVFDVQIAAGLVGLGYPLSLGNLVAQVLGITLPGGETRTDWRRRPLTPAQLRYALDDVRHLLDLADRLDAELARLGRTDWAEAEFGDFLDDDREPGRRGSLAAAPGPPPAQPPRPGDRPPARRVARRRGPPARTGRSARCSATTCWWRSPSASPPAAATWRPSATSTGPT